MPSGLDILKRIRSEAQTPTDTTQVPTPARPKSGLDILRDIRAQKAREDSIAATAIPGSTVQSPETAARDTAGNIAAQEAETIRNTPVAPPAAQTPAQPERSTTDDPFGGLSMAGIPTPDPNGQSGIFGPDADRAIARGAARIRQAWNEHQAAMSAAARIPAVGYQQTNPTETAGIRTGALIEQAPDFAAAQRMMLRNPPTKTTSEMYRIQEEQGFIPAVRYTFSSPQRASDVITDAFIENYIANLPMQVVGLATGGAGALAGAGEKATRVLAGATTFVSSYAQESSAKFVQTMTEVGGAKYPAMIDPNVTDEQRTQAWAQAFNDPAVMADAKSVANRLRGLGPATFDAISMATAGKLFRLTSPPGTGVIRRGAGAVAEATGQGILDAAGEGAGQWLGGEKFNPLDVAMEVVAGLPNTAVDAAAMTFIAEHQSQQNPNGATPSPEGARNVPPQQQGPPPETPSTGEANPVQPEGPQSPPVRQPEQTQAPTPAPQTEVAPNASAVRSDAGQVPEGRTVVEGSTQEGGSNLQQQTPAKPGRQEAPRQEVKAPETPVIPPPPAQEISRGTEEGQVGQGLLNKPAEAPVVQPEPPAPSPETVTFYGVKQDGTIEERVAPTGSEPRMNEFENRQAAENYIARKKPVTPTQTPSEQRSEVGPTPRTEPSTPSETTRANVSTGPEPTGPRSISLDDYLREQNAESPAGVPQKSVTSSTPAPSVPAAPGTETAAAPTPSVSSAPAQPAKTGKKKPLRGKAKQDAINAAIDEEIAKTKEYARGKDRVFFPPQWRLQIPGVGEKLVNAKYYLERAGFESTGAGNYWRLKEEAPPVVESSVEPVVPEEVKTAPTEPISEDVTGDIPEATPEETRRSNAESIADMSSRPPFSTENMTVSTDEAEAFLRDNNLRGSEEEWMSRNGQPGRKIIAAIVERRTKIEPPAPQSKDVTIVQYTPKERGSIRNVADIEEEMAQFRRNEILTKSGTRRKHVSKETLTRYSQLDYEKKAAEKFDSDDLALATEHWNAQLAPLGVKIGQPVIIRGYKSQMSKEAFDLHGELGIDPQNHDILIIGSSAFRVKPEYLLKIEPFGNAAVANATQVEIDAMLRKALDSRDVMALEELSESIGERVRSMPSGDDKSRFGELYRTSVQDVGAVRILNQWIPEKRARLESIPQMEAYERQSACQGIINVISDRVLSLNGPRYVPIVEALEQLRSEARSALDVERAASNERERIKKEKSDAEFKRDYQQPFSDWVRATTGKPIEEYSRSESKKLFLQKLATATAGFNSDITEDDIAYYLPKFDANKWWYTQERLFPRPEYATDGHFMIVDPKTTKAIRADFETYLDRKMESGTLSKERMAGFRETQFAGAGVDVQGVIPKELGKRAYFQGYVAKPNSDQNIVNMMYSDGTMQQEFSSEYINYMREQLPDAEFRLGVNKNYAATFTDAEGNVVGVLMPLRTDDREFSVDVAPSFNVPNEGETSGAAAPAERSKPRGKKKPVGVPRKNPPAPGTLMAVHADQDDVTTGTRPSPDYTPSRLTQNSRDLLQEVLARYTKPGKTASGETVRLSLVNKAIIDIIDAAGKTVTWKRKFVNRRFDAQYDVSEALVRVRDSNDPRQIAHEVGEILYRILYDDLQKMPYAAKMELLQLAEDLYGIESEERLHVNEGFAEWVHKELLYGFPSKQYREATSFINGVLSEHPEVNKAFGEARRLAREFIVQGGEKRVEAAISPPKSGRQILIEKVSPERLNEYRRNFVRDWIDPFEAIKKFRDDQARILAKKGIEIPRRSDPHKRAYAMLARDTADAFVNKAAIRYDGLPVGHSLRTILRRARKYQDDFKKYVVARASKARIMARMRNPIMEGLSARERDIVAEIERDNPIEEYGGDAREWKTAIDEIVANDERIQHIDEVRDEMATATTARQMADIGAREGLKGISFTSGPFTEEDADSVIARVESGHPDVIDIAAETQRYWNQILDYAEMTAPSMTPMIRRIRNSYSFYWPLFHDIAFDERITPELRQGSSLKRLSRKGAYGEFVDPFVSAAQGTGRVIRQAERQSIIDLVINLYLSTDGAYAGVTEVERPAVAQSLTLQRLNEALDRAGLPTIESDDIGAPAEVTLFALSDDPPFGQGIVPWNDPLTGKVRWFQIEPRIIEAFAQLQPVERAFLGRWGRVLQFFAHTRRAGTVVWNMSFGLVTNTMRDPYSMVHNSDGSPTRLMKNWTEALIEILRANRYSKDKFDEFERTVRDWEAGKHNKSMRQASFLMYEINGKMSEAMALDTQATYDLLTSLLESNIERRYRHPIDTTRSILGLTESAPRAAAYRTILETLGWNPSMTGDMMETQIAAQLNAQKSTVRFAVKGIKAREANRVVPFLNPNIQGVVQTGENSVQRPLRTIALIMATHGLMSLASWWLNKDEDWYKEMGPEKYLRWFFKINDKILLQMPRPFDYGVVSAVMEATADAAYRENASYGDWFKFAYDMLNPFPTLYNVPNPFILYGGVPLEWLLEAASNRVEFTGRPISPKSFDIRSMDPGEKYNDFTSRFAVKLGELAPGVINPFYVDHFIRTFFGSAGQGAVQNIDTMAILLGLKEPDRELELADIPIAGVLFRRGGTIIRNAKTVEELFDVGRQLEARANSEKWPETRAQRNARIEVEAAISVIRVVNREIRQTMDNDEKRRLAKQVLDIARETLPGKGEIASMREPPSLLSDAESRVKAEEDDLDRTLRLIHYERVRAYQKQNYGLSYTTAESRVDALPESEYVRILSEAARAALRGNRADIAKTFIDRITNADYEGLREPRERTVYGREMRAKISDDAMERMTQIITTAAIDGKTNAPAEAIDIISADTGDPRWSRRYVNQRHDSIRNTLRRATPRRRQ